MLKGVKAVGRHTVNNNNLFLLKSRRQTKPSADTG